MVEVKPEVKKLFKNIEKELTKKLEGKDKKKKASPAYKSAYSMGWLDFERFDIILKRIDDLAIAVRSYDIRSNDLIPAYYSTLKQYYINIREILTEVSKDELDEKFDLSKKYLFDWRFIDEETGNNSIPYHIIDLLEDINIQLYGVKQKSGMGIVLEKIESLKKKMERGMLKKE